ncbi:putative phosphatase regulatory subunit-domain-containing protein [Gilbertella persicaria]|uniref:putative phosphatase regulatory subunit-domain-containing protein n=1 Tax=Gilbertella persicaria TaxID=101096 RepID=UPI002220C9F8|nr:putative phosphatase regulatory subunit-domain-containing protein [Gilbertella persicaria]KAI8097984.1 putative phosphatase regulatory subunit-domain-containing protein [Gilbertella persicaria]
MNHSSFQHKRVNLIRRPPLIRSTSPVFTEKVKQKKSVRFCDNDSLENVRLFLKSQMPKACRSDPPLNRQPMFHLSRPNWPEQLNNGFVQMQDIELKQHQQGINLLGHVQVANLAFQKHVVIHYTLDDWKTVKTTEGLYQTSTGTWDRFQFQIELHHPAHKTLYLAVKYTVNDREFWDNNNCKNYRIDIVSDTELQDEFGSSSDSDDEQNTFDDIQHEEDDLLVKKMEPLSLTNNHCEKPLSPPLSPTTPVDTNPLWSNHSYFSDTKDNSDFSALNEMIQRYYRPSSSNLFHSTYYPTRSSPTTPKAVLG